MVTGRRKKNLDLSSPPRVLLYVRGLPTTTDLLWLVVEDVVNEVEDQPPSTLSIILCVRSPSRVSACSQ